MNVVPIERPKRRRLQKPRTHGGRFAERTTPWGLNPVECEITRLMAEEWLSAREVADRLCRDKNTIATYCDRIRKKMGARHQYQVIVLWDRHFRPQPVVFNFPAPLVEAA